MAVKIADDKRQTIIDGVLMCMSDFCMPLRKACAANGVGSATFIDWCNGAGETALIFKNWKFHLSGTGTTGLIFNR